MSGIIRKATLKDINFLVEAIIEAEKSGTDRCGLANFFNASIPEMEVFLKEIFEEEIDGCEFSLESFLIKEINGDPVATFGAWIESQNSSDLPSAILKSNLIGYILPKEKIEYAASLSSAVNGIQIERTPNTLQLEYGYCKKEYRGRGFVSDIIRKHLETANAEFAEVQCFGGNIGAIRLYEKEGFSVKVERISNDPKTLEMFPDNKKLVMSKKLK